MKNITLIAMENSANHGLGVNFCGYQLSISDYDSKEDASQRIRDVAKEYCNTKNSRRRVQMKKNKPRWKKLDMWERLARRCKQSGCSEDTVEHIREHGKQRKEK